MSQQYVLSSTYGNIYCESIRQELIESLKTTLQEAIEFNRQDAIALAGTEYKEEKIDVTA